MLFAFLPYPYFVGVNVGIEWNDGELCVFRKARQFREEQGKHVVTNGSRLVDGDSDVRTTGHTFAAVNVWETLVDTTWSAPFVSTLRGLDEVSQNLAPIDFWSDEVLNCLTGLSTDSTPSTTV